MVKTNDHYRGGNLWWRQMITTEVGIYGEGKWSLQRWEFMVKTNHHYRGRMGIYGEDKSSLQRKNGNLWWRQMITTEVGIYGEGKWSLQRWEFMVKTNHHYRGGNLWWRQMITTEEEWEFMMKTNDHYRGRMGIYGEDKWSPQKMNGQFCEDGNDIVSQALCHSKTAMGKGRGRGGGGGVESSCFDHTLYSYWVVYSKSVKSLFIFLCFCGFCPSSVEQKAPESHVHSCCVTEWSPCLTKNHLMGDCCSFNFIF